MLPKFPRREAGALIARSCFIHPDMHRDAVVMSAVYGRKCGAPIDRREPAGIAVGQNVERSGLTLPRLMDQLRTMFSERAVDRDIGVGDLISPRQCRGEAAIFRYFSQYPPHFSKRPAQIDRC